MTMWGCHTKYVTGEAKTTMRGWIHGAESVCLALWIVTRSRSTSGLLLFLTGKLLSCGASAVLHMRPHETLEQYAWWDMLDWCLIPATASAQR